MSQVISFEAYYRSRLVPPLVFVDLHTDQIRPGREFPSRLIEPVLANCRRLLQGARARGWPLGFVTPLRTGGRKSPGWVSGFEPQRHDMVFERTNASCYSSREFAGAITQAGGVFVLAGFSGDSACLSTMIDAKRNGHHTGLVSDASATRPLPEHSAEECHGALLTIAQRYASLVTTARWIEIAQAMQAPPDTNPAVSEPEALECL